MNKLTNKEMLTVNGGAAKWAIVSAVAGVIVLIVGIIDGYTNPQKCNN